MKHDWWLPRLLQRLQAEGKRPAPRDITAAAREDHIRHEQAQAHKRQTRYTYVDGPMYYLGQQIVKRMEDAGYPSKIVYCFRDAELQRKLYARGRTAPGPKVTNSAPYQSPHQFYEAVDICHATKGWEVSEDYWKTLRAVVRQVAVKFGVDLRHGDDWDGDGIPVNQDPDERFRDAAHIELRDWKKFRDRVEASNAGYDAYPTQEQLWQRFLEVLPEVARDWQRRQ